MQVRYRGEPFGHDLRLRGMASALEERLTALSPKKLAPTSWLARRRHRNIPHTDPGPAHRKRASELQSRLRRVDNSSKCHFI